MIFRFTLNNTIEGSHPITDPDGWKEINLTLERDNEYHSLVEMVELPLIFYRSSDLVDGGYDYIRNVEDTQGLDTELEILIECSDDNGETFETFFTGLLEIETIKDISDAEAYKLECNIVRTGFWSKFFSRKSQKVNLSASESIDGDSLTQILDINLPLPSQTMRENAEHHLERTVGALTFPAANNYLQMDWDKVILSEPETKFNYFINMFGTSVPFELYQIKRAGTYVFNIQVHSYIDVLGVPSSAGTVIEYYLKINNNSEESFTTANATYGAFTISKSVFIATKSLNVGDLVYVYGKSKTGNVGNAMTVVGLQTESDFTGIPSPATFFEIVADTVYPSSQTDAFLLRDASEAILSKIISRNNVMFSNYLGDETPTACAANYAIMKGLHVRGYSMFDKPMFMSFDEWWDGANPIFNLGLGYETIAGVDYIRIEHKGHFFNETPSLTFNFVDKITRTYDKDKIYKSIEIGYEKWSAESMSGVDDPQTKHTYNTRFKIVGKDQTILSKFFAASLGIEQTRRNRVEQGKDWRLDEDIMIIELSRDSSPFTPAFDESYSNISNLLNSSARYNLGLTVARNFERWKPFFNGCLQTYVDSSPCEAYKFASGEGNYLTETTGLEACNEGTLAENQDICVTEDHYFKPGHYEFDIDLSWDEYKTIRDNREKAILVSNTSSNHVTCFIDKMVWNHFDLKAKFNVWIK